MLFCTFPCITSECRPHLAKALLTSSLPTKLLLLENSALWKNKDIFLQLSERRVLRRSHYAQKWRLKNRGERDFRDSGLSPPELVDTWDSTPSDEDSAQAFLCQLNNNMSDLYFTLMCVWEAVCVHMCSVIRARNDFSSGQWFMRTSRDPCSLFGGEEEGEEEEEQRGYPPLERRSYLNYTQDVRTQEEVTTSC